MRATRSSQRATTLVELMVALALGLLAVAAAASLHQRASAAYRTLQTYARLQEVARLALQVLETDLRMANHWALHRQSGLISNRGVAGMPLAEPFDAGRQARIDLCGGDGSRWALRLDEYVAGSNDGFGLACDAVGTPSSAADTVVVRRAAGDAPDSLAAGRIYLQTTRGEGRLFVAAGGCSNPLQAACLPPGFDPSSSETRALVVRAYYVATGSPLRPDLPSLRRKSFGNVDAAYAKDSVHDEELAPGVEDLQVRFGIDTDHDGSMDLLVDPGQVPADATVLSATIWLRVRSEDPEPGHRDATPYRYGSMTEAWTPDDAHRRIVATRTVQLRNAPR